MSSQEALQYDFLDVPPEPEASVALDVMPGAEHVLFGLPDVWVAMYYAGNNPAKLVTLSALEHFPSEVFVDPSDVAKHTKEMQADAPGWSNTPTQIIGYCRKSLVPADLVEFGETKHDTEGIRLTERGRNIGSLIVGVLTPTELRTIENGDEDNKRLPLQVAVGRTSRHRGKLRGSTTRFDIYEALLRHPEGLSSQGIFENVTVAQPNVVMATRELLNTGIIRNEDREESNVFALTDRLDEIDVNQCPPDIQIIIESMKHYRSQGTTQISSKQLLDKVATLSHGVLRTEMSSRFSGWRRWANRAELIPLLEPSGGKKQRTRYTITSEYQNFLSELVHIKQMLVDPSPTAEAWRKDAQRQAGLLFADSHIVASLMGFAKTNTTVASDKNNNAWGEKVIEAIPVEGIDVAALHRKIVDAYGDIQYRSFLARLPQLPGIGVLQRPGLGKRGHNQSFAIKAHKFSADWTQDAACAGRSDIFLPQYDKTDPASLQKVAQAKEICLSCPVMLPCLKTAMNKGEQHAVRGAVWFGNRKAELPKQMADTVLKLVRVGMKLSTPKVMPFIPREGIDAVTLHHRLVASSGEELSYSDFINQLRNLPEIGILETSAEHDDEHPEMLILKEAFFSRAWADNASCRDMDPEVFYPLSSPQCIKPAALQQVESVKRICNQCPAKLPCLKAAIDAKETDAIRGGIWFANNKELTQDIRDTVRRMVHVQSRH